MCKSLRVSATCLERLVRSTCCVGRTCCRGSSLLQVSLCIAADHSPRRPTYKNTRGRETRCKGRRLFMTCVLRTIVAAAYTCWSHGYCARMAMSSGVVGGKRKRTHAYGLSQAHTLFVHTPLREQSRSTLHAVSTAADCRPAVARTSRAAKHLKPIFATNNLMQ